MFLVVGVVFLANGIQGSRLEERYREHGITAQAIVLDKAIERAKRGERSRTRYVIAYRFTTAQGDVVEDSAEVSVEEWERIEAGHPFPVTYLSGEPQSSRASAEDGRIVALVFTGLGGIFTLLGGGLTLVSLRLILRAWRLSREGFVAEGTVVHIGPTNTTINRVRQWRIRYRYRDHLGRSQEGDSHLLAPEEASAWHEGDTGVVRFDRERPNRSIWIGKS